jgi:hypothetical protein
MSDNILILASLIPRLLEIRRTGRRLVVKKTTMACVLNSWIKSSRTGKIGFSHRRKRKLCFHVVYSR